MKRIIFQDDVETIEFSSLKEPKLILIKEGNVIVGVILKTDMGYHATLSSGQMFDDGSLLFLIQGLKNEKNSFYLID